ncbi:MAG: hypothetical protein KDB86_01870 [Actinobacteria bacterium]|nr:hypothetical protein [Actinomycetota bacterium]MCB9390913.1 hypothetical protein [Acidimicrobiia bacterium]
MSERHGVKGLHAIVGRSFGQDFPQLGELAVASGRFVELIRVQLDRPFEVVRVG